MAVVVAVAAVVVVRAAVVENEVAKGNLLDHGEILEFLSQTVDFEGETTLESLYTS
jgi:hypothetical protein